MGITTNTKVWCDVCGQIIHGDYMTVAIEGGGPDLLFTVCLPRTAAINPCGNQLRTAVIALFPKAGR